MKTKNNKKEAKGPKDTLLVLIAGILLSLAPGILFGDFARMLSFSAAYFLILYLPFAIYASSIDNIEPAEKVIITIMAGLCYASVFVVLDIVFKIKMNLFTFAAPAAIIFFLSIYRIIKK